MLELIACQIMSEIRSLHSTLPFLKEKDNLVKGLLRANWIDYVSKYRVTDH